MRYRNSIWWNNFGVFAECFRQKFWMRIEELTFWIPTKLRCGKRERERVESKRKVPSLTPRRFSTFRYGNFFSAPLLISVICRLSQMTGQTYAGWTQNKWLSNVLGVKSKVAKCQRVYTQCVETILNEKRDEIAQAPSCLLDALISRDEVTVEEISATLLGFIVLGYDRLSTAVCSSFAEIARHKEIRTTVCNEINENHPIDSTEKVDKLMSLHKLLLEMQRLHPSPAYITKWIETGVPLNGFFLPPCSSILLYLNGVGRDQRFQHPDNFSLTRQDAIDTFGGRRQEFDFPLTVMKVLLGNLLKSYQFEMPKGRL